MANAQKKAQELAQAAGVQLGLPLTISDAGANLSAAPRELASTAVPLQAGELEVISRVQIVYLIQ